MTEAAESMPGAARGAQVARVDPVEAPRVLLFAAQALHHADAVEVFVQGAVDPGDGDAHFQEGPARELAPDDHHADQDGQHREGEQRQLPVEDQHRRDDDGEPDDIGDGRQHAGRQELLQHLHVGRHARHHASHFGAVVEALGERHQVVEHLPAHAQQHAVTHAGHGPLPHVLRPPGADGHADEGDHQPLEAGQVALGDEVAHGEGDQEGLGCRRSRRTPPSRGRPGCPASCAGPR